jgi:kynurenine formamidase
MVEIIDLTHRFHDDMPVFPGDPCARLYQCARIAEDGINNHKLETGMHVGTHMDAPLHMMDDGMSIADTPIENCAGRGRLLDIPGVEEIHDDMLDTSVIAQGDCLLIHTGWDRYFHAAEYYTQYPQITHDFAKKALDAGVILVAMDTPSPDDDPFPVHKTWLSNGVMIVENATNLELLRNRHFDVIAYPLKLAADAAPLRLVAHIHDNYVKI